MEVAYDPAAVQALAALSARERAAMLAAVEKLVVLGDHLPAPHSSAVKGASATSRELRPRGGRSQWRAFDRRIGDMIVIGSIGPEPPLTREASTAPSRLPSSVSRQSKRS